MFPKKDYRASAAGLLAATAVLFTGVIAMGAAPPASPASAVSIQDATQADLLNDCASDRQCPSDHVC